MIEKPSPASAYLDANVFIVGMEGEETAADPVRKLFQLLRERRGFAATSELTLAEVLVGPARKRNPILRRAYGDLIARSGVVELLPISRAILTETAALRAMHEETHGKKLKLPDAIHLVTAIHGGCRYFISDDRGIRPPVGMTKLSSDAIGEISAALS